MYRREIHYRHIKRLCREIRKPTLTDFFLMMKDRTDYGLATHLAYIAERVVLIKDCSFARGYKCYAETENPVVWIFFYGEKVHYAISFKLIDLVRELIKQKNKLCCIERVAPAWIFDEYIQHLKWQCKKHGVTKGLDKFKLSRNAYRYHDALYIETTRIIAYYLKTSVSWNKTTSQ